MVEAMVQGSALMAQVEGFAQPLAYSPLMTRQAFAQVIGLPVGVLVAQAERGYWPQITIGKRVFINVEAVRMKAAERAAEFTL